MKILGKSGAERNRRVMRAKNYFLGTLGSPKLHYLQIKTSCLILPYSPFQKLLENLVFSRHFVLPHPRLFIFIFYLLLKCDFHFQL